MSPISVWMWLWLWESDVRDLGGGFDNNTTNIAFVSGSSSASGTLLLLD
jgi:hypothetical protein